MKESQAANNTSEEFHVKGGMPEAYYVLLSAARLHDALNGMSDALDAATLVNTLDIDGMVERYGGEDPAEDFDVMAGVAAGLTVAAGVTAAAAPVSGPLTALAGVFSLISLLGEDAPEAPDPTAEVSAQLSDAYRAAKTSIDELTAVIYGGSSKMDINDIPGQTGDSNNALARFFADGRFLLQDAETIIGDIFDDYIRIQQLMIAGWLIEAYGYVVVIDRSVPSGSYCKGLNSMWWSDERQRCYYIALNRKDVSSQAAYKPALSHQERRLGEVELLKKENTYQAADDPEDNLPLGLDDGPMTVTINDFSIDLGEFYAIAHACAEGYPEGGGRVNADDLPLDGSKPKCFYSVPVVEGFASWTYMGFLGWADSGPAYISDLGLNTGGVRELAPQPDPPVGAPEDSRGDMVDTGSWCTYGLLGGSAGEGCCGRDSVGGEWEGGKCFGLDRDKEKCRNFYACCIESGAKNKDDDPCF